MSTIDLDALKVDLKLHLEEEFLEVPEGHFDEMDLKELIEDAAVNTVDFEGSAFLSSKQQAFLNGAMTAFHGGDQNLKDYLDR